ncbi:MAG TPA: secondary thiamine-phosphate synthase enzyme YjbQ [bacterium]|nr:secondary thiamine-phosphate synthase enzyme YjbQ [bacterium]
MPVKNKMLGVKTRGFSDVVDITALVAEAVAGSGLQDGIALVFVAGSTAGVTTIEYESGAVADLQRAVRELAPEDREYEHNRKWHDGNGFAHVRAALMGPGLSVPFSKGRLLLGTWQQIVLVDHDNRRRDREIVVQMVGE